MKTQRQDIYHQGEWYHRPVVDEPTRVNGDVEVIIPSYVRLSEHPTPDGSCTTGPLMTKPAGWYIEWTYPGDTNQHRGFFTFSEVKGSA